MESRNRLAEWKRPAHREFLRAIASATICAFGAGLTASRAVPSPVSRTTRAYRIVPDFANRIRIPQSYADEDMVRAGGLLSFNSNRPSQYRRAAVFVDKILPAVLAQAVEMIR